jgi:hypothetical protein
VRALDGRLWPADKAALSASHSILLAAWSAPMPTPPGPADPPPPAATGPRPAAEAAVAAQLAADLEAAVDYALAAFAANTRRAYEADWRDFAAYCGETAAG